jgi:hypothetical protein
MLKSPKISLNYYGLPSICDVSHPEYMENLFDWIEWRLTYCAGREFVDRYLEKFDRREDNEDFLKRKSLTPIPAFAAAAIDDVKNSIFQRAIDITRTEGSESYLNACKGNSGGVDRKGSTMNFFIGDKVIPELLTMKKVGVFVDMPIDKGYTQADSRKQPYIYIYRAEDIKTWCHPDYDNNTFSAVLLKSSVYKIDPITKLPSGYECEYRHYYINEAGYVVQDKYDPENVLKSTTVTELREIPFVVFEITQSLLKNIARHQVALLNLGSSDVNWIMKAGFPFYTEQFDGRENNSYLKNSNKVPCDDPDIEVPCDQPEDTSDEEANIGVAHGRLYAKGLERPGFIAPPTEPLQASMQKQEALRDEIRLLINLNLSTVQAKMASAESKGIDLQGLEAGLSYIGLELENGERQIARLWAMYENKKPSTIIYPKRYSLKSDEDQQKEVDWLIETRKSVVSLAGKKQITKRIASITLGNTISDRDLQVIFKEIDEAPVIFDDFNSMILAVKTSLVSNKVAAQSESYPDGDLIVAQEDAKKRLEMIQAAQTPKGGIKNPAARGLPVPNDNILPNSSTEKQGKQKRGAGK